MAAMREANRGITSIEKKSAPISVKVRSSSAGVEFSRRLECALDFAQVPTDRLSRTFRTRGWNHLVAAPHEKLIVQEVTQTI
jgi:hypothetical protein